MHAQNLFHKSMGKSLILVYHLRRKFSWWRSLNTCVYIAISWNTFNYCIISFLAFSQSPQSMQWHRLFLCDVDATNSTILGTIISDDQTTGKSVGLQSGQHCLFADIVYNSNVTHDYMFLEVNVEPRLDAGIEIMVSLLLILLFAVLLLEVFSVLIF